MAEPKKSELEFTQMIWTFFAGMSSRVCELFPIGHALERIRVEQNTNLEARSASSAIKSVYSKGIMATYQAGFMKSAPIPLKGLSGFSTGILWNFWPATFKTGLRWMNTSLANHFVAHYVPAEYKITQALIISAVSSVITTTATCPFEELKVRNMTAKTKVSPFNRDVFFSLFKFSGWRPMLVKEATIAAIFNTTYAHFLRFWTQHPYTLNQGRDFHLIATACSAAIAAAIATTPVDAIKDQMQKEAATKENRFFPMAAKMYRTYGLSIFVRTMPVKIARSSWYFAATTIAMDRLKALPQFMQPEQAEERSNNIRPNR